jgi:hypothetical protein
VTEENHECQDIRCPSRDLNCAHTVVQSCSVFWVSNTTALGQQLVLVAHISLPIPCISLSTQVEMNDSPVISRDHNQDTRNWNNNYSEDCNKRQLWSDVCVYIKTSHALSSLRMFHASLQTFAVRVLLSSFVLVYSRLIYSPPQMAQQSLVGQGLLIIEASRSHSVTLGRTPLDEWSARCRDLYMTTNNNNNK